MGVVKIILCYPHLLLTDMKKEAVFEKLIDRDTALKCSISGDKRKKRLACTPKVKPFTPGDNLVRIYGALPERAIRGIINHATHNAGDMIFTIPAVSYGMGDKRKEEEAYMDAYLLGASTIVYDMMMDMEQMHYGVLGSAYSLSPLYMFKGIVGVKEGEKEDCELRYAWSLPAAQIYSYFQDVMILPLGIEAIQIGLAALTLQTSFECEEDRIAVKNLLYRYSYLTKDMAYSILDAWRVSNANLLERHTEGRKK